MQRNFEAGCRQIGPTLEVSVPNFSVTFLYAASRAAVVARTVPKMREMLFRRDLESSHPSRPNHR